MEASIKFDDDDDDDNFVVAIASDPGPRPPTQPGTHTKKQEAFVSALGVSPFAVSPP